MVEWAEETDVLMVGSGAGGLGGAYTAAREGLDVVLVEASEYFGGTAAYSGGGGIWYPVNHVLQAAGTDDTLEDALEYYQSIVGDKSPKELQEAYIEGGPKALAYFAEDENLVWVPYPWPDYFGDAPKARGAGDRHVVPMPLPVGDRGDLNEMIRGPLDRERLGAPLPDMFLGGRALAARFLMALEKLPNATLHRNSPLESLVVEDGRVVGALIGGDNPRAIRVRKGVVMAAGGFDQNDEMRREFGVPGESRDSMGAATNLGKAHRAGIEIGADVALMDQAWWSPGLTHPGGRSAFAVLINGGIFVNDAGERFVNESEAYDALGRNVIAEMAAGRLTLPYWMVYDDRNGIVPPVMAPNVSFDKTEKYVDEGLWLTADTLEELAGKIGVPADNLVATVQRFNDFAVRGKDDDFGRGDYVYDTFALEGAPVLVPIEQGPFHAARFGISDLGTKGGLRTTVDGQVVDTSGNPIPGLYAAGNTMAPPSGEVYPGGGNPIGTSLLFAWKSVLHLAGK